MLLSPAELEKLRQEFDRKEVTEITPVTLVSANAPQPDANGGFETPAEGAKFMADQGVPQIPLRGKIAFQKDWTARGTTDFTEIDRLYAEFRCNFGSVAQAKIGGYFALEVDSADVKKRFETDTTEDFTPTLIIRSSSDVRGHRWYKQTPESIALGNVAQGYVVGEDFSVRVNNEYCVSPGSVHPETKMQYRVAANKPTVEASPGMIEWFGKQRIAKKKIAAADPSAPVLKGGRNDALTSFGGRLRHAGLDHEMIEAALLYENEKRCQPPLSESEVKNIAGSVSRYEPAKDFGLHIGGKLPEQTVAAKPNEAPQSATPIDVSNWRELFRSVGEMEDGPIVEVIHGVLQEGTCFLGASPSDGKTLVSLAMAKAICTGEPLFGLPQFYVPQARPVIYLIPESGDRAFRRRCEDFHMPDDKTKFMARTISSGPTLPLDDPYLLQAVKETKAVVFLDTAVRFMKGGDENSAAENRLLVNDVIALLAAGAVAVVLDHHATKASQNEEMTMENMLRGTSDLAAMCDQIYGIRKDRVLYARGAGPMEIEIASLKDREQIGELTTLRLAASRFAPEGSLTPTVSIIRETGNFHVIDDRAVLQRGIQHLVALVKRDPQIPVKELAEQTGMSEYAVEQKLKGEGWHRVKGGKGGKSPWHQDLGNACPFEKNLVEIKPSKKTYDLTLTGVVKDLGKLLEATRPDGDYVPETEVLQWADKQGIPETQLNRAKRRLGVVVTKEGDVKTWALPVETDDVAAEA